LNVSFRFLPKGEKNRGRMEKGREKKEFSIISSEVRKYNGRGGGGSVFIVSSSLERGAVSIKRGEGREINLKASNAHLSGKKI